MAPLKELDPSTLLEIDKDSIREVEYKDFENAFNQFVPSYNSHDAIKEFEDWGKANRE